jgi:hypothetical protein
MLGSGMKPRWGIGCAATVPGVRFATPGCDMEPVLKVSADRASPIESEFPEIFLKIRWGIHPWISHYWMDNG